jgi:hypothetical protein
VNAQEYEVNDTLARLVREQAHLTKKDMHVPAKRVLFDLLSCLESKMPGFNTARLPPPESPEEFEKIVTAAAQIKWKGTDFQRYGRSGQIQDGVDTYACVGQHAGIAIQCKNSASGINFGIVKEEVEKATKFRNRISTLYIATAQPNDKHLQDLTWSYSTECLNLYGFSVGILFWEDLIAELAKDRDTLRSFYREFMGNHNNGNVPQNPAPRELEREAIRKLLVYLEDRRSLYISRQVYAHAGRPEHLTQSVLEIRKEITATMQSVKFPEDTHNDLETMRSACRTFLDDSPVLVRSDKRKTPVSATRMRPWQKAMAISIAGLVRKYELELSPSLSDLVRFAPNSADYAVAMSDD